MRSIPTLLAILTAFAMVAPPASADGTETTQAALADCVPELPPLFDQAAGAEPCYDIDPTILDPILDIVRDCLAEFVQKSSMDSQVAAGAVNCGGVNIGPYVELVQACLDQLLVPSVQSSASTSAAEVNCPNVLGVVGPYVELVRDCVAQIGGGSENARMTSAAAVNCDVLGIVGPYIDQAREIADRCLEDIDYQMSTAAAVVDPNCDVLGQILPIVLPIVDEVVECANELLGPSYPTAQAMAIPVSTDLALAGAVPDPDCHVDNPCDVLYDADPLTVCDVKPCPTIDAVSTVDCPPELCDKDDGTGIDPYCFELESCSGSYPGYTGYRIGSTSACVKVCEAGYYGVYVNGARHCYEARVCDTDEGRYGVYTTNEETCVQVLDCDQAGEVGARVENQDLCVDRDLTKTCAEGGYDGYTGAGYGKYYACHKDCESGYQGAYVNGVRHCAHIDAPDLGDADGDGYADSSEASAGSNPTEAASTPETDDDRDGKINRLELVTGVNQGRALCTGAYGFVGSSGCGGYATPSGTKVNGNVIVDSSNRVWVWDGVCDDGATGNYNACTSTSNYSLKYTKYSGSFYSDGYGWRMMADA
ncbi:MAG: hypothetical protein WC876_06250 [Candidatus Thermoplasmatota archaeon]|jgi:hypothetical protein